MNETTLQNIVAKFSREEPSNAVPARVTEGRIIAVEICSTVLEAHVWLSFADDFNPQDGQAVFYADELQLLKDKSASTLRKIYETKKTFGPGTRVRQ